MSGQGSVERGQVSSLPFFLRPCGKIVDLEKLQELKVSKEELGAVRKVAIFSDSDS